MSKFTPGPWSIDIGDHGASFGGYWQINAEMDAVVCNQYCMAGASNPEVSLANARLIAAAPEMYALLWLIAYPGVYEGRPTDDEIRERAKALKSRIDRSAS